MFRNFFSLINLSPLILVLITSCVLDIENPTEESLSIEWITINYDQVGKKLFLQLEIQPINETIDSVIVKVSSENYDSIFILNDKGVSGDIIADNNRYSVITEVDLPLGEFQFKVVIDGFESEDVAYYYNEEQFLPKIEEIIFIKSSGNNQYEFNNDNSPFYVNENDTSYLKFKIKIKDQNGINNIQSVRYKTVTNWDSAEGNCGCIQGENCINSSPIFYLENIDLIASDSIFTYVSINDYVQEPGFPINPASVCNRTGVIIFSFIIIDLYFGPQTFVEELLFLSCSELNCNENCETCPFGCGECEE